MSRPIFVLFLLLCFSCAQEEKIHKDSFSQTDDLIWHLNDTIYFSEKLTTDSIRQINLDVDIEKNFSFVGKADAPFYLFQGGELVEKSSNQFLNYNWDLDVNQSVALSLDENVQKISFGVYSKNSQKLEKNNYTLDRLERANTNILDNVMLILVIGASVFMVIIKLNYDKRFLKILSYSKIFTIRLNEAEQSRVRTLDQDNIVFASFYTFLTAGLIYFLILNSIEGFIGLKADGIFSFINIWLIVIVALISKVFLISIVSGLFGNSKITAFYIKEMLNINLFFIIILFFSTFVIYANQSILPSFWLVFVQYALIIFYLIRLILLFFKILKLSSFTYLYLFSYFCTTEIFPFLIGLKYFIR